MARRRSRYDSRAHGFPEYVSAREKMQRVRAGAEKLRRSNADIHPVVIEGRRIARTWWGRSWNANLERYADYSNRIGRGRRYVRHGAVLDLRIEPGRVTALVQGSRSKPYDVAVKIDPLNGEIWEALRESALTQLDSLSDLLAGGFPEPLKDAFFAPRSGLFPPPGEIRFDCSCPDWASMCKHVAAVLYGIGNRLDEKPDMFFTLRQVHMEELVHKTLEATAESLLDKSGTAVGDDVLDDDVVADVFGIEFDDSAVPTDVLQAEAAKEADSTEGGCQSAGQAQKKRTSRRGTMIDKLVAVLPRGRKTFQTAYLRRKLPDWTERQVRNTLSRAVGAGRIERVAQGAYRRSSS